MHDPSIHVEGARQNNLKGISVRVPIGAVTVVTGVAGAGKSSLAFEVLYAEGYRRYVETFSPYARQFLERLDRPKADLIAGVLPSIAIDRTTPVRTSRSTVGTMTSIADYLRALWARAATLVCRSCGKPVLRHTPSLIFETLMQAAADKRAILGFPTPVGRASAKSLREVLTQAGFRRVLENGQPVRLEDARLDAEDGTIDVVVDRLGLDDDKRDRIVDSLEATLRFGKGRMKVWIDGVNEPQQFSEALRCEACDIDYNDPTPALFSFNNPIGACETCKGFGRAMDIDPDLVIPNGRLSIAEGAIKPFKTPAYQESQEDLLRFMTRRRLPIDKPWRELDAQTQQLIWEGEPGGRRDWETKWYGINGFFAWLQSKSYRMHVRIFLSNYRRYLPCPDCRGARLKPDALLFRINGRTLPDLEALPVGEAAQFFESLALPAHDTASELLLREIRGRLRFLVDVGLAYLTLARQSRTLSGGETQRVALATALGSSLTNTLYVLDEPSVGLHPQDSAKLTGVLRRLAQAGNAVVVVEHDATLIAAADHVIDLGPGPGKRGGEVVYEGPLSGLTRSTRSRTAAYMRGEVTIPAPGKRRPPKHWLHIKGARENNLKNIDVAMPLGVLACVTGISGSGKSTLIDQILYRNLQRALGRGESEPGACDALEGAGNIADVILVDQAPPARSSRMNAATYMGVLEPLRAAFASAPEARKRGLGASAFSFNSAQGACPHCEGAGFEKLELQFLPDVYVKCPGCDGRRFRPEVLEVSARGYNIADMLDLPASEVARIFADNERVVDALQPLIDIGLGYLSLSQPAPTLSGGEAQRLKLARYLAQARETRGLLFILDEPTSGLHAADVAVLTAALQQLVDVGHSVIVVEHNMDVAKAADWIIDLGPGGGDAGGEIMGAGTPEDIASQETATGQSLRPALRGIPVPATAGKSKAAPGADSFIHILGAREHNLHGVHARIPRDRLVAITGVSGSGKSTLAFDVLYAEGQRRFLDCLPAYARQFIRPLARPEVDRVEGIPPTVALEQKLSRGTPMSTVATASEIYHYLRLLFAALGSAQCPNCGVPGEAMNPDGIARRIVSQYTGKRVALLAPLLRKRKGLHRDLITGMARQGIRYVRVDGMVYETRRPPSLDRYQLHDIEALIARLTIKPELLDSLRLEIEKALSIGGGTLIASARGQTDHFYSTRRACPSCGAGLPFPDPRLFSWSQRFGACEQCGGLGMEEGADAGTPCSACGGTRLRPEALAVRIGDKHIGDVAALSVHEARTWVQKLAGVPAALHERVMPELDQRLKLLDDLGLGYLGLDRSTDTLSTGEAQRVRIVAALASNLRGVCYVLDEPTVGLHPRDDNALIQSLLGLRDRGNTVVVVEHDEATIRAADYVIDLGPGAGPHGGNIIAAGAPALIAQAPNSVTGFWLRGAGQQAPAPRSCEGAAQLQLFGVSLRNLRDVDVALPLGRLVCIGGVSGSGKSTLVRDALYRALKARLGGERLPRVVKRLKGHETLSRVVEVDESPIGRTPRSVPATYVGIMDSIRALFAGTAEARARGYSAGRFSFNVGGGRCERCEGQGRLEAKMALLPVVYTPCERCGGRRYNLDTLVVTYKGKTIAEVLEMSVDEAREFFAPVGSVRRPLDFLSAIGLGYLQLGQPSPTLSGGEAQRIKLAAELASPGLGRTLYILDEPTTGLHMADVARLLDALQGLVERGDSVVVIEHNLDVMAAADHVIELGPEGGDKGGRIVATGTPARIAASRASRTAPFLREHLQRHAQTASRGALPAAADPGVISR